MQNKLTLLANILFIVLTISFFSCQKFETAEINTELENIDNSDASIQNTNFNPDFKWGTTKNISFNIKSANPIVVNIKSVDKLIKYHKGMHPGNPETYAVKISVPTYLDKISINNKIFELSSDLVLIQL